MNPQPPEYVGSVFAWVIIGMLAYYTIKAYNSGKIIDIKDLDLVHIGYIESDNPVQNVYNITNTTNNTKVSKTLSFESQQLYVDCVDALVALGMKKTESKKRAKHIFSTHNPPPSTVQEFLIIALNIN